MTVDFDSTILTRQGFQEGIEVGYNPKKPGRDSHHPLMAFVVELRNDYGIDGFCMDDFYATEAAFMWTMVAHNIMSLFRLQVLMHELGLYLFQNTTSKRSSFRGALKKNKKIYGYPKPKYWDNQCLE